MTTIHKHPEEVMYMPAGTKYEKESHIHFRCNNINYDDTLKIFRFLRQY